MTKQHILQTYFQRKDLLTTTNTDYKNSLLELFHFIVHADHVEAQNFVPLQIPGTGTANIISKQNGVIAGIEEVLFLADHMQLTIDDKTTDGSPVSSGQTIMAISGNYTDLLTYERVILNILGRMSGIATKTHGIVETLHATSLQIAATRKTPWMLLDKKAVAVGGGLTHRLSLHDWPMIKDTDLKVVETMHELSLQYAIKQMIANKIPFFEIEVATPEQAITVIQTIPQDQPIAIMLDNFDPKTAQETIIQLQTYPQYEHIIIEASGNITEETTSDWVNTGVDIISLGSLTHSAPNFDLSMRIE